MGSSANPLVKASLSDRVSAVIQQAIEQQRLVGAVVLIARHGHMVYRQAAGLADRENNHVMTPETIFRLASVSKPIVSAAALVLVARGQLDLDSPVSRWLPEFTPMLADGNPATITARQLLSHTAGLGYRFFERDEHGPYAAAGVSDGMDAAEITLEENLRRIARVPLQYTPGRSWAYSLATDVLGALVARINGTTLDVAVRELITDPLAMRNTGFYSAEPQRVARAYVNDQPRPHLLQEGEIVPPFPDVVGIRYSPARIFNPAAFPSAGAGMAGTADDFLRLLEALRDGETLLPRTLVEEMSRDWTHGLELEGSPGIGFGLGFSVLRDPQLAASPESPGTWRWGGAYGHSWFVDPQQELSVIAFTNTLGEGMSGQFVNDLRDAVYGISTAGREAA
ncbi:CubicO group peptidase (beta-lactamase class C family) [Erwinia sp. JUb26]|nr:serine hydrolase domain-containing protein [Erwinia sp. JUb26]ROR10042.1 CubicO group peptidase (beta-lactamase class C family) [Erwinia sp. JUb26]